MELQTVSVNITLQTLALTQAGFGKILVLSTKAGGVAYQEVSALTELTGITSTDDAYKAVAAIFSQNPRPATVAVLCLDTTDVIADELDALITTKNDWYILVTTTRTKADVNATATWALANGKLFIGTSTDETVSDGRTGLREVYIPHGTATEFVDAAWAGRCAPTDPGSITWAYKRLAGINDGGWTPAERTTIEADNANYIAEFGGVLVTYPGKTSSGEFIDVVRGMDWVNARIKEALQRILIINDKIPYTLQGFSQADAAIREVLTQAGSQGIIATVDNEDDQARSDNGTYQYKVNTPASLDDIPANDRANRKLPITFEYRVSGAVHLVDVDGFVTV